MAHMAGYTLYNMTHDHHDGCLPSSPPQSRQSPVLVFVSSRSPRGFSARTHLSSSRLELSSHQVSQDIISPRLTYQQDIGFDHICF